MASIDSSVVSTTVASPCQTLRKRETTSINSPAHQLAVSRMHSSPRVCSLVLFIDSGTYCYIHSKPSWKPFFVEDNGWHITVGFGSLSVNESKKTLGKCILARGTWHSPPEFEALGRKKSKKLRQSLMHLGRRLCEYD